MSQGPTDGFDALLEARATNLRQLLQAATRRLNVQIAEALTLGGYGDITGTHTMLLSNMTLRDDTVTSISQRASVSPQFVGRLVKELEELGYLRTVTAVDDARIRRILVTQKGRRLMKASFAILEKIESEFATKAGATSLETLRRCLSLVAID